jgi:hypothetical protein
VCPARDTGVALVLTRLDTAAMNLFLAELSQAVAAGAQGVVLMDKAGWHTAGDLVVPENLSLSAPIRSAHLPSFRDKKSYTKDRPAPRWRYLRMPRRRLQKPQPRRPCKRRPLSKNSAMPRWVL